MMIDQRILGLLFDGWDTWQSSHEDYNQNLQACWIFINSHMEVSINVGIQKWFVYNGTSH